MANIARHNPRYGTKSYKMINSKFRLISSAGGKINSLGFSIVAHYRLSALTVNQPNPESEWYTP